jgi:hypothetical protein
MLPRRERRGEEEVDGWDKSAVRAAAPVWRDAIWIEWKVGGSLCGRFHADRIGSLQIGLCFRSFVASELARAGRAPFLKRRRFSRMPDEQLRLCSNT